MSESLSCYQYRRRYNRNSSSTLVPSNSSHNLPFMYRSYLGQILNTSPGNDHKNTGIRSRHKNCVCCTKPSHNHKVRELRRIFDTPPTEDNAVFPVKMPDLSPNIKDTQDSSASSLIATNSNGTSNSMRNHMDHVPKIIPKIAPQYVFGTQKDPDRNADQNAAAQAFTSHSLPVRANLSNYSSTSCHLNAHGNELASSNEYILRKPRSVYASTFRSSNKIAGETAFKQSSTPSDTNYTCFTKGVGLSSTSSSFNSSGSEEAIKPICNIDMFSITDSELEKPSGSLQYKLSKFQTITNFDQTPPPYTGQLLSSHCPNPIIRCSKGQVNTLRERFERKCSDSPYV